MQNLNSIKKGRAIRTDIFICSICKKEYKKNSDAVICASQGLIVGHKIGDIVITSMFYHFGWYDGQENWIYKINDSEIHQNKRRYSFYYVVTGVKQRLQSHIVDYSVLTLAMSNLSGYRKGYTCKNHILLFPVENPPEDILQESKVFLNQIFTTTL